MVTPVFVMSLPRSGSTLLQRLLAAHSAVATTAEPWLLLPLVYTQRDRGIYTEYSHRNAATAINDLCQHLPKGQSDYNHQLREFVLSLYAKLSPNGERFFIDKTPRYYLIIKEIAQIFPDAKFVFLWRNPLSTVASMLKTWGNGHWYIWRHRMDLYDGLERLTAQYVQMKKSVLTVRYEDLVLNSTHECERVLKYLGVESETGLGETLNDVVVRGRLGDPTGINNYSKVSSEPLNKWKLSFRSPLRKHWARQYLNWIGTERLALMGYAKDELENELETIPVSWVNGAIDTITLSSQLMYCATEPHLYKEKFLNWKAGNKRCIYS